MKTKLSNAAAGAHATFEGWVRNHNDGKSVTRLEYQAFESLANKEASLIMQEARSRFDILDVHCLHRIGSLAVGDLAVWVGVTAAHRNAAFDACRYVIDQIKLRVPIWKKEHYTDGSSEWVNCTACSHETGRAKAQPLQNHRHTQDPRTAGSRRGGVSPPPVMKPDVPAGCHE